MWDSNQIMKSIVLFIFSFIFVFLGSAVIGVDLWFNHSLHVMNGSVGAGLMAAAIGFLFPVQFDHIVEKLGPYLPFNEHKPDAS